MAKKFLCAVLCMLLMLSPVNVFAEDTALQQTGEKESILQQADAAEADAEETAPAETAAPQPEETKEEPVPKKETEKPAAVLPESLAEKEAAVPQDVLRTAPAETAAPHTESLTDVGGGTHTQYTQTYLTEDGKEHTIYWVRGVTPPLMTSDPDLLGKPGYFEKDFYEDPNNHKTFLTYQASPKEGSGYYDLNKTAINNYCYLGSATNLLHWWMQENAEYIRSYEAALKAGQFCEPEGHASFLAKKDALTAPPVWTRPAGFGGMTELARSPLAQVAFGMYFNRKEGGYMDTVQDFFINGYPSQADSIKDIPANNSTATFCKDPKGGYFYPVFGRDLLTERITKGSREEYNRTILDWIQSGKGISLSYHTNMIAHAITVWGAEYDENGDLVRFYVTDTDDYENQTQNHPDMPRGLYSSNIHWTESGLLRFTNNTANEGGALIQTFYSLDLGQDRWKEALADHSTVEGPVITAQPEGRSYGKGAPADALTVSAAEPGSGEYLSYQWYQADSKTAPGKRIEGATEKTYRPTIASAAGTTWYYCEVTLHKRGFTATSVSDRAEIVVLDEAAVNAQVPTLIYDVHSRITTELGSNPGPLRVEASVSDGGTLSYQWFESRDSSGDNCWLLKGETGPEFHYPTNREGRYFYGCIVTNTNDKVNGQKTAVKKTMARGVVIEKGREPQSPVTVSGLPVSPVYGESFQPVFGGGSGTGDYQWEVEGCGEKTADGRVLVTGVGEITLSVRRCGDGQYQDSATVKKTLHSVRATAKELSAGMKLKAEQKHTRTLSLKTVAGFPEKAGEEVSFRIENAPQEEGLTVSLTDDVLTVTADSLPEHTEEISVSVSNMPFYQDFTIRVSLSFEKELPVMVKTPAVGTSHQAFAGGVPVTVTETGRGTLSITGLPDEQPELTIYSCNEAGVPVGMQVYRLTYENGSCIAENVPELTDLLSYHGFSLRISEPSGIRFKTGISKELRTALLSEEGLAGYHLKEYGTLVMSEKYMDAGFPMILGGDHTGSGKAFYQREDGSFYDKVLEEKDGRYRYASVMTGIPVKNYKKEYGFRGYIKLEYNGEEVTLYGPIVRRSAYGLAVQLQQKHPAGSAMHRFVSDLIARADAWKGEDN